MRNFFSRFIRKSLQILLPYQCGVCRSILMERGVCGDCFSQLTFLGDGTCRSCGLPLPVQSFEGDLEDGEVTPLLCGGCIAQKPPFQVALSVFAYDDVSRPLITRFKHGGDLTLVPLFSRWLGAKGSKVRSEVDVVVPVPLHWTRLVKRRFNQSALLAQAFARKEGLFYDPLVLKRTRRTPSQGHLRAAQRILNVKGAFTVPPAKKPLIEGVGVLLVDDVYTTGATLTACAQALLQSGAREVSVLTLARVV
jgi:ComF family protein